MSIINSDLLKIYFVLESSFLKTSLEDFIDQIFEAGIRCIQLRDKFAKDQDKYITGKIIQKVLSSKKDDHYFIINDRLDLALALKANGVHLGIKDIPVKFIRKNYPNMIIGCSCNNEIDITNTNKYADYLGIGPVYPTDTKKDLRDLIGINGLKVLIEKANLPTVAIGGINKDNILKVFNTGISGVALSSYISISSDPYNSVLELFEIIKLNKVV